MEKWSQNTSKIQMHRNANNVAWIVIVVRRMQTRLRRFIYRYRINKQKLRKLKVSIENIEFKKLF